MTTALGIIEAAMRKAGVLVKNQTPSSDEAADGLETLNDLLAALSLDRLVLYARTTENFPITAGIASYTIGTGGAFNTARPIKIVSAYVRQGTTDYPLGIVSDELFASIASKTNPGGIPDFLNFVGTYPLATINLHPSPASAYQLFLVTEKPLSSFTLNQTVDLPPGWKRMLVNNLAVELGPEYGQPVPPETLEIARQSKGDLKAAVMASRPMQWNIGLGAQDNIYSGWWN